MSSKNPGTVVWFTGLSGSGKTTLARELKMRMEKFGKHVKILDGDEVRKSHTRHLGFSRGDIKENNRIIASLAQGESGNYDFILVPIISPYREDRQMARSIIGEKFVELFVDAPLEICSARDSKGLYKKAERGEIKDFIGVSRSNPYESPLNPEIQVKTDTHSITECVNIIAKYLKLPTERIILIHLGRSGGATLRNIIERQFSPRQILRVRSEGKDATLSRIENMSPESREKIRFIAGHIPLGAHKLFSPPSTYITLVRDPISRIVSEYNAILRKKKHEFLETARKMTLRDYALSGINTVHNHQTRVLSGNYLPGQTFGPAAPLPPNALEIAQQNILDLFAVAGVTEKFDETVLIMQKKFGWKNTYYIKQHVSPRAEALDPEIRAILERQNELDLKLHAFISSLLEKAIKDYGPNFDRDLNYYRKMNRIYQPWLHLRRTASDKTPPSIKKVIRLFI